MSTPTPRRAVPERSGAQTVCRAIELLRLGMEAGGAGLTLREATALTGWSKSSVHRLLAELAAGGLLLRAPGRAYVLGRFAHELGLTPSPLGELQDLCAQALARIRTETCGTVFLGMRSGTSSVCVDYALGDDVRPPIVPPRGSLRPLGVGAAGLAVLSWLRDEEVETIGARNQRRMAAYGGRFDGRLMAMVRQARSDGFARVANIVEPGVVGIGACIADPVGTPL